MVLILFIFKVCIHCCSEIVCGNGKCWLNPRRVVKKTTHKNIHTHTQLFTTIAYTGIKKRTNDNHNTIYIHKQHEIKPSIYTPEYQNTKNPNTDPTTKSALAMAVGRWMSTLLVNAMAAMTGRYGSAGDLHAWHSSADPRRADDTPRGQIWRGRLFFPFFFATFSPFFLFSLTWLLTANQY